MTMRDDDLGAFNGYHIVNSAMQEDGSWVAHSTFWRAREFAQMKRDAPSVRKKVSGSFASIEQAFAAAREFAYEHVRQSTVGL